MNLLEEFGIQLFGLDNFLLDFTFD